MKEIFPPSQAQRTPLRDKGKKTDDELWDEMKVKFIHSYHDLSSYLAYKKELGSDFLEMKRLGLLLKILHHSQEKEPRESTVKTIVVSVGCVVITFLITHYFLFQ